MKRAMKQAMKRPTLDRDTEPLFAALADRTRLEILARLRHGEISAGDIALGFRISRPAVSRHVRVLRKARLVRERRDGRIRYYALNPEPLLLIDRWLEMYRAAWHDRLVRLKRHAESGSRS